MQYFNTLPKVIYTDEKGKSQIFTNLMARASVIPSFLKNPVLYYQYDIQEGDTPEIIAHKYYGDSYRYWIVLFANEMLDPQWDWPLTSNQFNDYMMDKYPNINTSATVHHYEKITTTYDVKTLTTTTNIVELGEDLYNRWLNINNEYTLPTGNVILSVTSNEVSVYDYELQLNENKRNIKLLNSQYVTQFEAELEGLMSN